jgi:carbonic anhydrase
MYNKKFPMELHLVHASDSGQLAVLGVLFQVTSKYYYFLID